MTHCGAMNNLRDDLLKLMGGKNYKPMDSAELARSLGVQGSERRGFRVLLSKLEKEGRVKIGAKRSYKLRERPQIVLVGKLRFQPNGNGWFFPVLTDEANIATGMDLKKYDRIFVDGRDMSVAMDGDHVSLKVTRVGVPKWKQFADKGHKSKFDKKGRPIKERKGPEKELRDEAAGRVLKILERKNSTVIGIYREEGKYCFVVPESKALPPEIDLLDAGGAKRGQLVAVEVTKWTSRHEAPVGRVTKVIGFPDAPGVDIISVIHKHNLRVDFEPEVQQEADAVSEQIPRKEIERREDWRDALVMTVDPGDAKDHDDAVLVEKTETGWKLAVHIADVSHYVTPGSALDKEAELRGNSTYLVDRVLPMLPEKLSNNICSLRPNVDRLTKCAVIEFDLTGTRKRAYFCDAVINSKAKLAYEEAQVFIKGSGGGEIGDAIRTAWSLAEVLRKRRFNNGALDLDFPEVKVVLDPKSKKPIEVKQLVYDESHQMIEEFMLSANEAVAVELKMKRRNALHRIHEDPDADRLNEYAEIARIHGFKVGDLTNKKHIQDLLRSAKGTPVEQSIKLGLLKSLKRAAYSTEALGHYGLAKMDYCHFTSPIRRYADLVVHRALQHVLSNPPANPVRLLKAQKLEEVAQHISTTERTSGEAENATKRMKMMEYLFDIAQKESKQTFNVLITDVRRMGLFVEITDMQVKGLVKKEALPKGDWVFDQSVMAFRNYREKKDYKLGQRVNVQIARVDMERQLVDFVLIEE